MDKFTALVNEIYSDEKEEYKPLIEIINDVSYDQNIDLAMDDNS